MSDRTPCDDHETWKPRCAYCRGLAGGTRKTTDESKTMSKDVPDLSDLEVVQLMAAQAVVKNHHDDLHEEYIETVRGYCDRYGVEFPDHYDEP